MAFLNDWRGKIAKAAKTVKDTSGDLYKTSKINLALGSEQESLKKIYLDIGKKVHEIYQYGGILGKFFDEKYEEIRMVEEKIENLQKQLEELKQVKICPHCMKEIEQKAAFCPHCGEGVKEVKTKETEEIKETTEIKEKQEKTSLQDQTMENHLEDREKKESTQEKPQKICPVCKTENAPEDRFCMSCGRAIF
ncbi:MAG: zinc-ribbon domain-containing protein [Epulopiscium sp.]|nr:zinc-ribbon domain-containing protein [Candidatus Epulonipiscium sp.]